MQGYGRSQQSLRGETCSSRVGNPRSLPLYKIQTLVCVYYKYKFVLVVHVGEKLKSSDERDSMIVDCLVSLGRLDEAAKKLTEMIIAKPDQWAYIRTYIKCQMQRCQNFRERVRQQLERDRRSRDERDSDDSTTESREDDVSGELHVPAEVGLEGKEEKERCEMVDGFEEESDEMKVENVLNLLSERPTEGDERSRSSNSGEGGGEEEEQLESSVNNLDDDVNEVTIR